MDVQVIWSGPLVEIQAAETSNETDLELSVAENLDKDSHICRIPVVFEKMSSSRYVCCTEVADEEMNSVHGFQCVQEYGHSGVLV